MPNDEKTIKKNTFLKRDNDVSEVKHLYFVLSDPDDDDNVLLVNATTFHNRPYEDKSCILDVGDHSFIKHKSYINYREADDANQIDLLKLKFQGKIIFKGEIANKVLRKIQEGAKKSKLFPKKFKKYFEYF